jgi:hypothetical protein
MIFVIFKGVKPLVDGAVSIIACVVLKQQVITVRIFV